MRRCQLFSASPMCRFFMKQSATWTISRCQFPLFLVALGHSTVSTPNSKGELSVGFEYPDVVYQTLGPVLFPRPRPVFTSPANAPNITRWVSRSLVVSCTAPAKRSRHLRMVVSTPSHCAFLRALAYDMRWSVRCRR